MYEPFSLEYDIEEVFSSSDLMILMIDLVRFFAAQAFFILAIQTIELSIVLLLLKCPGKPQYDITDFFRANKSSKQRSWLLASVLGFGVLLSLVFITSYFAERLIGPKVYFFIFTSIHLHELNFLIRWVYIGY